MLLGTLVAVASTSGLFPGLALLEAAIGFGAAAVIFLAARRVE